MSDTHRFFAAASDAACERVRLAMDSALGYPSVDGQTITCFMPAAQLPHDANGRPLLAVDATFCEYEAVAAMLPDLIASGAVEEMTREQYHAAMVPVDDLP